MSPSWLDVVLLFGLHYSLQVTWAIVALGLTIWLAWRYPTLGSRPVRSTLIVLVVLVLLSISHSYVVPRFPILLRPLILTAGVVVMVLARRVFKIVLVKRRVPEDYQPTQFSIRELMIWTLVIAGFLALHQQLMSRMQDPRGSRFVGIEPSSIVILGKAVSQALLTVLIVWCQRFSFYKWFPAVMIGYILCSQIGLPGQFPRYSLLLGPVIDVGNTAFVVWAFQKLGFRFLHAERRVPIRHDGGGARPEADLQ